jgi:hypothetical protein
MEKSAMIKENPPIVDMCLSKVRRPPPIINKCATRLPKWDVLNNKHGYECKQSPQGGRLLKIGFESSQTSKDSTCEISK